MKYLVCGLAVLACAAALGAQTMKLPAGITVTSQKVVSDATIYDLSWPAPRPEWSEGKAWLVMPKGASQAPAIFYFHMYGSRRDRNQFLAEATANAKLGIAAILIQGSVPWWDSFSGDQKDVQRTRDQIEEIKRVVGILLTQDWVDPSRIAFVGHDYGAMYGALLVNDPNFCVFALMAPSQRFGDWINYFNRQTGEDKPGYDALFGPEQPVTKLSQPHKAPVLLQFAENDQFISGIHATEFGDKVAEPKTVQLIPKASHEGIAKSGQAQRLEFLKPFLLK